MHHTIYRALACLYRQTTLKSLTDSFTLYMCIRSVPSKSSLTSRKYRRIIIGKFQQLLQGFSLLNQTHSRPYVVVVPTRNMLCRCKNEVRWLCRWWAGHDRLARITGQVAPIIATKEQVQRFSQWTFDHDRLVGITGQETYVTASKKQVRRFSWWPSCLAKP